MQATFKQKMLFISPTIVYLLAFSVYPLIYALGISFTDLNLARQGTGLFVGIRNYIQLLKPNGLFIKALMNNFIVIIFGITVQLVIGYIVARLFFTARNLRGINILRTVYIIPIMITPLVFGLISSYIFNPMLGIANHILTNIGLDSQPWYGDPRTALFTIILVDAWQWTPFMVIVLLAGLMGIPLELYENAEVDGANLWHKIFLIEIPLIGRVIGIAAIMRLMELIRMFALVYATTRGGPGGSTEIISMFAYRQAFNFFNTAVGSTAAILALFLTVTLSTVLNKNIKGNK